MKKSAIFRIAGGLLILCLPLMLHAQETRIAYVDFMYVPEGMNDAYVTMEKEIAKPVHRAAVDRGRMVSWSLWAIPFPGGTKADYHYATVRIYEGLEQMKMAGEFGDLIQEVHAAKNMDEIVANIIDTRDLVKTHRLFSWEQFMDEDLTQTPGMIQVVYFKVPFGDEEAYQRMERDLYHPLHKREIEKGKRAGWEGWALNQPFGTGMPYSHVAVDLYTDIDQFAMSYDNTAAIQEVHPDKSSSYLTDVFLNTVDLVRIEQWFLVDSVQQESTE